MLIGVTALVIFLKFETFFLWIFWLTRDGTIEHDDISRIIEFLCLIFMDGLVLHATALAIFFNLISSFSDKYCEYAWLYLDHERLDLHCKIPIRRIMSSEHWLDYFFGGKTTSLIVISWKMIKILSPNGGIIVSMCPKQHIALGMFWVLISRQANVNINGSDANSSSNKPDSLSFPN